MARTLFTICQSAVMKSMISTPPSASMTMASRSWPAFYGADGHEARTPRRRSPRPILWPAIVARRPARTASIGLLTHPA